MMLTCTECGREGSRGFVALGDGFYTCVNTEQCAKRVARAEKAKLADRCVDCLESGDDPKGTRKLALKDDGTRQPGPRCVTHWRARRKIVSQAAHAGRLETNFGITAKQYQALYAAQGGKCFVCAKSTGKARRLAVDHDHLLAREHDHDPKQGCPRCIRALLCKRCNTLVGWLDVEALTRAIVLLTDPPARKVLAERTIEVTIGEPTAISLALPSVEIDEEIPDGPVDDFWGPDAVSGSAVDDDFWAAEADEDTNAIDNFWLAAVSEGQS